MTVSSAVHPTIGISGEWGSEEISSKSKATSSSAGQGCNVLHSRDRGRYGPLDLCHRKLLPPAEPRPHALLHHLHAQQPSLDVGGQLPDCPRRPLAGGDHPQMPPL